ncbi:helix-turn-helix domain-containing protein (plasmid) [Nocardia sp. NBC_01503]|uniref:helix-turn-helix domain-containing transcriptional regulator n=1 Tax=Nocardia sp. NBC_01503 TaxID=2975997 RepID=UPI002E7C47D0|nr:helix-turn-helix domain-containing protein [Nocardia sp. NBC_01503]WTL36670.1 helix-turn-helix domain-containing protein [Nocardia sp. NBC_01503]WTL36777.1 helix-turn-helix domain-containing protein [Nocardia sp. NBC_01503]
MSEQSVFWDDLAEDLKDPDFLREFVLESVRIKTVDSILNMLDQAREQSQLSKAALARAASIEPAAVRRLLSARGNPTLHTVSELAAALGLRLTLEPLDGRGGEILSDALVSGIVSDLPGLGDAVEQFDRAS